MITDNNNTTHHYYTTDDGLWDVGPDYNDTAGWLKSSLRGLLYIPEDNWKYGTGGAWVADNTLHLSYWVSNKQQQIIQILL